MTEVFSLFYETQNKLLAFCKFIIDTVLLGIFSETLHGKMYNLKVYLNIA